MQLLLQLFASLAVGRQTVMPAYDPIEAIAVPKVFQKPYLEVTNSDDLWGFSNATTPIVSSHFERALQEQPGLKIATVAAGCFWGVEDIYREHFFDRGIVDARVGYSGGDTEAPTYKEVCTNTTNHAEALQILYDPRYLSYETIVDLFFRMHDPTTLNRQGHDVGSQYRSAIFTSDEQQQLVAMRVLDRYQQTFWKDPITTKISPIKNWWDAETYHQLYLEKNPQRGRCESHFVRTEPQT